MNIQWPILYEFMMGINFYPIGRTFYKYSDWDWQSLISVKLSEESGQEKWDTSECKNTFVNKMSLGARNLCCMETKCKNLLDGDDIVTKISRATTFITKYLGTWMSALQNQEVTTGKNIRSQGGQRAWKRCESLPPCYPWRHLSQRLLTKNSGILFHWNYIIKKQGSVW